jgi:hypothetical protein
LAGGAGVVGVGLLLVLAFFLFGREIPGIAEPSATPTAIWTQTPTPLPTRTATSTPVPTPTPNLAATQVALEATASAMDALAAIGAAREWPVLVWDSFDDNHNDWMVGKIDDEFSIMTLEIAGWYRWEIYARQGFVWRVWPQADPVSDFYLAVEVQNLSDNLAARYGLVFWSDESTYYYIEVQDSGLFLVSYYDGTSWNHLIDYTSSSAILAGQVNHLEAVMVDETFYLLINNVLVGEASAFSAAEGQAGVALGLSEEGDQSIIAFDNFVLRAPSDSRE